jgi:membrane fusion protein, multidrug efflux system
LSASEDSLYKDRSMNSSGTTTATFSANHQRRLWLGIIAASVAVAGVAYGAYWSLALRYHESTDDAYVSGNVVQITPQVSGTVVAIHADDTQFVNARQPLVQLDEADARVALDQAEAQLAKTVREVRNLFATSAQLQAALQVRESELATAGQDLARRERLANSGAISKEELQHARDTVSGVRAAYLAADHELAAHRARIDNTTLEQHPDVLNAAAAVRSAFLAYSRTTMPAPVSGYVAKRSVQLGQRVSPGTPLMAIVPLDQVWVDANFREAELASIRFGQPVTLTADLYGRSVRYHGKVAGFGAGTGAAFALLPAQNATGNWIKIVQRVPVRIALDARELAAHPLQIGLSMTADVDTRDRSGARLPQLAAASPSYETDVFGSGNALANEQVQRIITANAGQERPLATRPPHTKPVGDGAATLAALRRAAAGTGAGR